MLDDASEGSSSNDPWDGAGDGVLAQQRHPSWGLQGSYSSALSSFLLNIIIVCQRIDQRLQPLYHLRLRAKRIEVRGVQNKWDTPASYALIALYPATRLLIHVADGTLHWQAPELMEGVSKLAPQMDIYSFAMSCMEVLTKGSVPWFILDDDSVRHLVLRKSTVVGQFENVTNCHIGITSVRTFLL